MSESKEFKTSDIYFAGLIVAKGNKLVRADKDQDGRKSKTVFVFSLPEEDLMTMKSEFFSGQANVNATQYMYALKSLKSLCFV